MGPKEQAEYLFSVLDGGEKMLEYKEYRNKDNSREEELHDKGKAMDCKFYKSELMDEIPRETYDQLSLPS